MRQRLIVVALVVAALLPVLVQSVLVARVGFGMGDFRAFYCAARVAAHGENPYLDRPLRACEIAQSPRELLERRFNTTLPAPLPGYTIAALIPLSMLPLPVAAIVWFGLLLLAWLICQAMLIRFTNVAPPIALASLALSLGMASIPFGEIVPIAVAAICAAAYFAREQQWSAAAVAAAVAMIEPHLGLPVCIALAVWAPATRFPLAVAFISFAALSVIVLGPSANLEYVTSVLPSHALSEASRDTQFSLTSVLVALGATETAAVRAGTIWYVAMLVAGTIAAGAIARKTHNHAFLACVPPAFAVFGGTFIHVTQIVAAVPVALLILDYVRGHYRVAAIVALLLLAVPWIDAWSPGMALAPAFPVAYLVWRYSNGNLRWVAVSVVAAFALLLASNHTGLIAVAAHAHGRSAIDPHLAEASWSRFADVGSTTMLGMTRIPTWIGLAMLLSVLVAFVKPLRETMRPYFIGQAR